MAVDDDNDAVARYAALLARENATNDFDAALLSHHLSRDAWRQESGMWYKRLAADAETGRADRLRVFAGWISAVGTA